MKTLCICAAMMVAVIAVAQTPDPVQTALATAPVLASQAKPAPAEMIARVKMALSQTNLPGSAFSVSTHAEAIVLSGHASSAADAAKATSAAQTAAGDIRVINEIEVPPTAH